MSLFERNIAININPGNTGELELVTSLQDMYHNIRLFLTITTSDFLIKEAYVEMEKIPHPNCHKIKEKVAALAGAQVGTGFTKRVLTLFKGEGGCPNLANLIFLTAPLAINATAVLQQQRDCLTEEEMDVLWNDVLGGVCVAYPKKQPGA
jgi:hypothetical protein